jgi:hypothetical protein
MGFRSLIKKQVRKAFAASKDLTSDITLLQKDATGFNFTTGAPIETATISTTLKCIVERKERNQKDKELTNTVEQIVYLISEDVQDLTIYDKVTMNGFTWNIAHPCKDDGYLTTVLLKREG